MFIWNRFPGNRRTICLLSIETNILSHLKIDVLFVYAPNLDDVYERADIVFSYFEVFFSRI